jgi:hypothetical protein
MTSGLVDKRPKLSVNDKDKVVVSLKCIDELGRLTYERAKSDAHYQDQQIVGIINDLFTSVAANWTFLPVNMVDPLIESTLDLRNKETLFSQISEAIRSVPNLHMRYGGIDSSTGEYVLEIGDFGDLTEHAYQGSNLIDVKINFNTNKVFKTVESFGDLTPTNRINLSDALSDARTIAHADYAQFPISQDAITGAWICTNTAISFGNNIRKSLNIVKTKNDVTPTAAQIAEAGYALWLKTVRLMKSSVDYDAYSGSYISQNIPKVGDKIKIKANIKEDVYSSFTGKQTKVNVLSVDDDFKITKLKHDLGNSFLSQDSLKYKFNDSFNSFSFEATSNDEAEEFDPDLELYERLERFDNYDNTSGSIEVFPVQSTVVTFGNADAADCSGATGKTYLHTSPSYPGWVTNVTTWYTVDQGARIVSLTEPVNPGDNWSACVKPSSGNWPPAIGADITVTVFWLFT